MESKKIVKDINSKKLIYWIKNHQVDSDLGMALIPEDLLDKISKLVKQR